MALFLILQIIWINYLLNLYDTNTSALSGLSIRQKDDIENLFYVLIYLKKVHFPGLNLKKKTKKDFWRLF